MDLRGQTSGRGWGRVRRLLRGRGLGREEEVAADSCAGVWSRIDGAGASSPMRGDRGGGMGGLGCW